VETASNDSDVLSSFVRVEYTGDEVRMHVRTISWRGPYTPVSTWRVAKTLPAGASEADVDDAMRLLLEDRAYFARCAECGLRRPAGYMHGDICCQLCAAKNHGIVY
jgi:hypothetical protein